MQYFYQTSPFLSDSFTFEFFLIPFIQLQFVLPYFIFKLVMSFMYIFFPISFYYCGF